MPRATVAPSKYLRPKDVAQRLNTGSAFVIDLIKGKQIPALRIGTGRQRPRYRILESDFQAYLAKAAAAAAATPERRQHA